MTDESSGFMEYKARAVHTAVADVKRREIVVGFVKEPGEESLDLSVRIPAGVAGALCTSVHAAARDIENSNADTMAAAQPLMLTGAEAADPVTGRPALILRLGAFALPVFLPSVETARQIAAALEQSAIAVERPNPSKRLS
jgi:hypothetical protein